MFFQVPVYKYILILSLNAFVHTLTESEHVRRVRFGGYPPSTIQPLGSLGNPATILARKQQEIDAIRRTRYSYKPSRGDFLIHPEWPPTFQHHRVD